MYSNIGDHDLAYRALCRLLCGPADVSLTSTLGPEDWRLLAATARREGVAPLLYHTLNQVGWPAAALPDIQAGLRQAYHTTAAHNLLIYHELTRILAALRNPKRRPFGNPSTGLKTRLRAGSESVEGSEIRNPQSEIRNSHPPLPVILLKGAALATTIYPDPALRPLSDIDLLVPREHLRRAVQAVRSLGYREAYPEMVPELNQVAGHHVHLRGGPQQSVTVELHWNLVAGDADWRTPPMEWFWSQTEPWKMENGKGKQERGKEVPSSDFHSPSSILQFPSSILQLTPTAHLLYLAAHLMLQHGGAQARLLWYYDLHLLMTREGERLDWDALLARAREFRWTAALRAALQGAQERFGTPLPAGFLDALAETQDAQAARLVERMAGPVQTRAVRTWDHVASQSWRGRLRLAWAIACPSPEYMQWRYRPRPAWLWPLYYPYRWFDIVWDGLSTLWRIGKGKVEGGKWTGENGKGKMERG